MYFYTKEGTVLTPPLPAAVTEATNRLMAAVLDTDLERSFDGRDFWTVACGLSRGITTDPCLAEDDHPLPLTNFRPQNAPQWGVAPITNASAGIPEIRIGLLERVISCEVYGDNNRISDSPGWQITLPRQHFPLVRQVHTPYLALNMQNLKERCLTLEGPEIFNWKIHPDYDDRVRWAAGILLRLQKEQAY